MTNAQRALVEVLRETKAIMAGPDNDLAWSHWKSAAEAFGEIDRYITAIESGNLPDRLALKVLFAPTGPIQEVSISSGWGVEFLELSQRFDSAEARVYDSFATRLKAWLGLS